MADNLSYLGVIPHLRTLQYCGFYQLDSDSSKTKRFLHTAYMRFILFIILLYTFQQILKVYEVRDNLNKVMNTLLLLLTNTDAIYKQVVLWKRAHRIEVLFNVLKGPVFNQKKPEHEDILLAASRESRLLLRVFNVAALVTCFLWAIFPVIVYVQRKPVEFTIWLPFDANLSPQFYFAAIYMWAQTSFLAMCNTSQDVFISYFLLQCKTQLSILRLDLEHIVQKSKEEAANTLEDFTSILERRLKIVIVHYGEIVKFSVAFDEIFGGAITYLFCVGGWIIGTTAYKTANIHPASVDFMSMVMYMACVLVEVFIYCHYGNEVTYESEKLIESAYAMDWLEMPLKSKRNIIIFMERIKRTVNVVVGSLVPLSNKTFVSLVRSSYSFFAFLKNSN